MLGRLTFVSTPVDGVATAVSLAVADDVADTTDRSFAEVIGTKPSRPDSPDDGPERRDERS